jgi:translation initiation factor 2 subunit 2
MKRKDVLRQLILDLSPNSSTTIFNQRQASLAPKLKTESLATQHLIDNPVIGTGIFAHDATDTIPYDLLLQRLFLQKDHFPSLNTYGKNEGQVVKPYVVAMGKRRTIFANFQDVRESMKRDGSHVFVCPLTYQIIGLMRRYSAQFIFRELGTSGSFDNHENLVLKGRFLPKNIDNVVKRYDVTYGKHVMHLTSDTSLITRLVKCSSCNSTNTDLRKTDVRVMLVTCNACGTENRAPVSLSFPVVR